MLTRLPVVAFALAMVCISTLWAGSSARANELKASFAGTAINTTLLNSNPANYFDGALITGTFDLFANGPSLVFSTPTVADPLIHFTDTYSNDGGTNLTFNLMGMTYSFTQPTMAGLSGHTQVFGTVGQASQSLVITTFPGANLTLYGTSFLDPANPSILTPGTSSLAGSNTLRAFGLSPGVSTGILITSLTVDASVPEPATILLTLSSLAALTAFRKRPSGTHRRNS